MTSLNKRPIPDGRMRIIRLLTDQQKEALRALQPDGLLMLNFYEVEINKTETWIEYWFEDARISEDDLRSLINQVITNI